MIKLTKLTHNQGRIVRETTATLTYDNDGESATEVVRVRYRSLSIMESRAMRQAINDKEHLGELFLSDILFPVIESFPDILDENDKPVAITEDLLESLNSMNLRAIQKAITEDIEGKSQAAK